MRCSLDDLRTFAAVVRAGGFRAAARDLDRSASTLSDIVRKLERDLGVGLLARNTRSAQPTEAGRRLLDEAIRPLGALDRATDALWARAGAVAGPLRITTSEFVARHVLPGVVPDFLARFPEIRLEVSIDDDLVDIVALCFDAAIRYDRHVPRDMVSVPIGPRRQRHVAAASPAYLERHGTPTRPTDLKRHRLIGDLLPSGGPVVWELEQDGRTVRVTPAGPLTCSSIEVRLAAATAGIGIIHMFEEVVGPAMRAGLLVPVLEGHCATFAGPVLAYHSGNVGAALGALLGHLRDEPEHLRTTDSSNGARDDDED